MCDISHDMASKLEISVIFLSLFTISVAYASPQPVSHWKFDGSLTDHSELKNDLQNTYPVFLCGIDNQTKNCFESNDPNLGVLNFTDSLFGKAVVFNGKTFFTVREDSAKDYDFLEYDHPFTIEWWMNSDQLCTAPLYCFHQYIFSKAETIDDQVTGFGIGIQRDGAIFTYLRNPETIFYTQTNDDVVDKDILRKYSVVYGGSGTWDDLNFYVNGELMDKRPFIAVSSNKTIRSSIQNNSTLVIGNYWYRYAQPIVEGSIDDVKIYDYAKNSQQIQSDFFSDISSLNYDYQQIKHDKNMIPNWVKLTLGMYATGILYQSNIDPLFLWFIEEGIITSSITPSDLETADKYFLIPDWMKNVFILYYFDKISDTEMINLLQYSLDHSLIKIL